MSAGLLAASAFVTTSAVAWAVLAPRSSAIATRAARYAGEARVAAPEAAAPSKPTRLEAIEARLQRAGLGWTAGQAGVALAFHALAGLCLGAIAGVPLVGLVIGAVMFHVRLKQAQTRRTRRMHEQLPDALMLMASAIKSGLGLQQALQLVADETPSPLAEEFQRLAGDMAIGLSLEDALARFQDQLASADAEMLVAALLVQRQTGGNLSDVLFTLHNTIRDRQALADQVRTLTAQGRLSGVVLGLMPVGMAAGLAVIHPTYLSVLVTDPRGQLMAGGAMALMVMAMLWIRQIIRIRM